MSTNADFLSDSPYHEMLWLPILRLMVMYNQKRAGNYFLVHYFKFRLQRESFSMNNSFLTVKTKISKQFITPNIRSI